MLTRKQHELLMYVNQRLKADGVSPSFDEMKDALNLRSKSGIHRLVTALEERGFIRRLPHRARALEVLKLPDSAAAPGGFEPNVIRGPFENVLTGPSVAEEAASVNLPLYGRIAAGTPIEALRDHSNTIDVPASILGRGEHYALAVAGDSMVDAGIYDGDTALIERCDTADSGTIVVALIDDYEVTLKRLRQKGASIALEPANTSYETRIFPPHRVKVQGRLVGLMRKY
ncbi:MAG: transcriptional repressor LexA [Alphaproteobacteria bacterium]